MNQYTDFFQIGGNLEANSPSYVTRKADQDLEEALERGEFCMVLAPRQTGKSSLMVRMVSTLEERGVSSGVIDLQPLRHEKDPDRWFRSALDQLERSLGLATDSEEWWLARKSLGPTQRFMNFLEDVVLTEKEGRVVIFIDEIDSALPLAFSDDFFTSIRALYNARATRPGLKNLSFVLLGVASADSLIKDKTRTPFNIGVEISLTDLDKEKIDAYRGVLGPESGPLLDRIFYWTNGQPLMFQKLGAAAYSRDPGNRTPDQVDEDVRRAYLEKDIKQDRHLSFIQNYLLMENPNLRRTLKIYQAIIKNKKVAADEKSVEQQRLRLAGVVSSKAGRLLPRNRIYARIFNICWTRDHYPRDLYKTAAIASFAALLFVVLYFMLIQPLFFPRFPNVPEIVRYTPDAPVEIELSLEGSNVSRVVLDAKTILEEDTTLVFQDKIIEGILS